MSPTPTQAAFTGVTNALEPSPQQSACRFVTCSLKTVGLKMLSLECLLQLSEPFDGFRHRSPDVKVHLHKQRPDVKIVFVNHQNFMTRFSNLTIAGLF